MYPGEPIHLSTDQLRQWFAHMVNPGRLTGCVRIICTQQDHRVGEISFDQWDSHTRTTHFNIRVASTARRNGYGRAAMHLFVQHFFTSVGGNELIDDVATENTIGQQALHRFGFTYDPTVSDVCRLRLTQHQYYDWCLNNPNHTRGSHGSVTFFVEHLCVMQ